MVAWELEVDVDVDEQFNYSGDPNPSLWEVIPSDPPFFHNGNVNGTELELDSDNDEGIQLVENPVYLGTFEFRAILSPHLTSGSNVPTFSLDDRDPAYGQFIEFNPLPSSSPNKILVKVNNGTLQSNFNMDIGLPGYDTMHTYKIVWNVNTVEIWVDGLLYKTFTFAPLRPCYMALKSQYVQTGKITKIDWIKVASTVAFTMDCPTFWDQDQPPRKRRIATQGRNWNRVHHEGADALTVILDGVIEDTTPRRIEERIALLRSWRKQGTPLTLVAPDDDYYDGLSKLEIESLVAPRQVGRLTSREVSLSLVRRDEDP
jgi:hypothetical protein